MADVMPTRPKRRGYETALDMLRSLGPLVLLILFTAYFCVPHSGEPIKEIDPTSDIRYAAQNVDYALLAPEGLGDDWHPTSSKILTAGDQAVSDPDAVTVGVTIGYVTPGEKFCRFAESSASIEGLLHEYLPGAEETGTATVDGRKWTLVEGSGGDIGMWADFDGSAILLSGSAVEAELTALAGTLAPAGS